MIYTVILGIAFFFGATLTVPNAYDMGYKKGLQEGYFNALADVEDRMDLTFEWEELSEGKYKITAFYLGEVVFRGEPEIHLWIEHYRNGKLLSREYGAGVLTNIGADWIEQQISGSISTNATLYCADSNDAGSPLATWTELPSEITANGLDRQTGAYSSTGIGTWNVTVTKNVTGTQSTQLWGLHWNPTDGTDNNLMCADSGPSQKNCVNGDTLQETWQCTVS